MYLNIKYYKNILLRDKTMVKKVYICDEDCDECPFGNVNCSDAKKKTV
jgi:hypothetical protein